MDIHCSIAEGGQSKIQFKTFHFAEVINEWPLDGGIIETQPSKDLKFLICALYVSTLSLTNLWIPDSPFVAGL